MNNETKKGNVDMNTIDIVKKYIKGETGKNVISDYVEFGDIFFALAGSYQLNDGIFEHISPFLSDEANCVMRETERLWN